MQSAIDVSFFFLIEITRELSQKNEAVIDSNWLLTLN